MKRFGYIIVCLSALLLFSCEREQPGLEPMAMKAIHYQVSVGQEAPTKASLDGSEHYIFQDGDRLYVAATGADADKLYGFLHLISGAGAETAVFDGDLYSHYEFEPSADTELSVTLVGANDRLHTVSDGRITSYSYSSSACAATFADAVQQYSHFTASGHFRDRSFTLAQQSSFLRCNIKYSAASVPDETELTIKILDGSDNELRSASVLANAAGSISWARFVAVFPGGEDLTGAKLSSKQGSADAVTFTPLNSGSSTTLAANTYYNVTRSDLPIWDGFKVTAREELTLTFNYNNNGANIKYSKNDGETWNDYSSGIHLDADEELCLKGTRANYRNTSNKQLFTTGGKSCYISGNMMSLLYGDSFESYTTLPDYAFLGAFKSATWIDVLPGKANTLLTALTLSERCYEDMFRGCTNLTLAPDLPATTLAGQCYIGMFRDCDYLTVAPVFPTGETPVTVADSCCFNMFRSCDRLTTIPTVLPATNLCQDCYREMFRQCTALKTVNVDMLPSTNLAPRCYQQMFGDCSNLTNSPSLPAVIMEEECYRAMFGKCSQLTVAPTLPATTLVSGCYRELFSLCSKLASITCLATSGIPSSKDAAENSSTYQWLKGVKSSGTFYHNSAINVDDVWSTYRNEHHIPNNWTPTPYTSPTP